MELINISLYKKGFLTGLETTEMAQVLECFDQGGIEYYPFPDVGRGELIVTTRQLDASVIAVKKAMGMMPKLKAHYYGQSVDGGTRPFITIDGGEL